MEEISLTMGPEESGERLDTVLARLMDGSSRSFLQKCIKEGQVTLNGKKTKPGVKVAEGDLAVLNMPDPTPPDIPAENIPLDILYEDDDLIFVNKPKGMVVHPAPGHTNDTLVNALLYHCGNDLSGINGIQRPGIVHRIDRDTTGVLVACKNDFAHTRVAEQLAAHSITRIYTCLVHGNFAEEEGTVDAPIGRSRTNRLKMAIVPDGKPAVTHYQVLERFPGYTLLACRLETGRTHQIRVHMTSIHHPLVGDEVYGNLPHPWHLTGQTLHAGTLGLIHPRTGKYLEVTAPLPQYFEDMLRKLKNKQN